MSLYNTSLAPYQPSSPHRLYSSTPQGTPHRIRSGWQRNGSGEGSNSNSCILWGCFHWRRHTPKWKKTESTYNIAHFAHVCHVLRVEGFLFIIFVWESGELMDSHPRVFRPNALDKHERILMGTGWLFLRNSPLLFQSKTICFDTDLDSRGPYDTTSMPCPDMESNCDISKQETTRLTSFSILIWSRISFGQGKSEIVIQFFLTTMEANPLQLEIGNWWKLVNDRLGMTQHDTTRHN